jgi:5-methylcytosine-specific restriction endonuclease McrA
MNKEELIQELAKFNWDRTNVELAIRANFKCEYCKKDLLENMDNYKLWQVDHIIPKSSGYVDCENFNNKALTCTQCNKDLKGKWNPAIEIGEGKKREEYISLVKMYISEKRNDKNLEVAEIRKIINNYSEIIK